MWEQNPSLNCENTIISLLSQRFWHCMDTEDYKYLNYRKNAY